MRIFLKFLVSVLVISLISLGSLWGLNQQGFFLLEEIEIKLSDPEFHPEFAAPLISKTSQKLNEFKGTETWRLDLAKIQKEILSQNWIRSLKIQRQWPQGLSIEIEPKPLAVNFLNSKGQLRPVNSDGELFSPVSTLNAPDLVLLRGEKFAQDEKLRKRAIELLKQIPPRGSFSRERISELHFDSEEGFWFSILNSSAKVKMNEEDVRVKSARLAQVIDYLDQKQIQARVIDANLSKKVLVRLRKDP